MNGDLIFAAVMGYGVITSVYCLCRLIPRDHVYCVVLGGLIICPIANAIAGTVGLYILYKVLKEERDMKELDEALERAWAGVFGHIMAENLRKTQDPNVIENGDLGTPCIPQIGDKK